MHKTIRVDSHITNRTHIKHEPQYHVFKFHQHHNQSPIIMLFITFKITQIHTRVFINTQTSHLHNHYAMQYNIKSTHACSTDSTNGSSHELGPLSEPWAPTLRLRQVTRPLSELVTRLFRNMTTYDAWHLTM